MKNKPGVTTDENSFIEKIEKESLHSFKLLTPTKLNNINNSTLQNFYCSTTHSSPFGDSNLLSRKRKYSDLNSGTLTTISKESPFKTNRLAQSPITTETKITSFFQQKKNFNLSKNLSSNLQCAYKGENAEQLRSTSNFSFAKRLQFESMPNSESKNDENLRENQNIEISRFKFNDHLEGLGVNEDENLHFDDPCYENFINEKENISEKNYNIFQMPKISDKTQNIIFKLGKSEDREFIKRKNLNLNFHNLVKNNNYRIKGKPSPKKPRIDYSLQNIEKYLTPYSIKDKYEELLTRDLILPCHYKYLLKKFEKLDETLNNIKNSSHENNIENLNCLRMELSINIINSYFMEKYDMEFTKEDFQKILFVTPHFFIYKWDIDQKEIMINKDKKDQNLNYDLFIDIPCDIQKRIDEKYTEKTNFTNIQTFPYLPLSCPMSLETLKKRSSTFKKILLHITNEHHKAFIKEKGIVSSLNPFKHRTWHSEFEIHNVKEIEAFKLIDQPHQRKIPN